MQAPPAAPRRLLAGLLLLTGCVWVGSPELPPGSAAVALPWAPEADPAVVANRGLRVHLGRAAWLDPTRDLVLQVQPGDRCHLTVLDEDPLWQRPGQLSPRRFPCDFGAREVQYSHLGGRRENRLIWHGVLHGLKMNICSTMDLHGLQGHSLPHNGLHHGLQGNLCSGTWSSSYHPSALTLVSADRFSHIFSLLSPVVTFPLSYICYPRSAITIADGLSLGYRCVHLGAGWN